MGDASHESGQSSTTPTLFLAGLSIETATASGCTFSAYVGGGVQVLRTVSFNLTKPAYNVGRASNTLRLSWLLTFEAEAP
jgi:hypothetical protein